ncbi:hypothetical protein [Streptomyces sp. RPT161]|uniref:hypothetical protein n=1 Tax=Streptomyces sp. RPT161 TaxID=3015993 RepID=UPI0022B8F10A|nr:hypothetical protein [Streptomyces sp. RPT161]
MIGEPVQAKRLVVLPAVLGAIGLSDVSGVSRNATALLFLVATAGASVLLGVLRGMSVRLSNRQGLVFVRYTGVTVALWVVNLLVKFGANLVLGAVDPHVAAAVSNSLLLTLGIGMLAEGLVVLARAVHADSRIAWSKGENGAPHTMSPVLDGLQRRIAENAAYGPAQRAGDLFSSTLGALRDTDSRRSQRN